MSSLATSVETVPSSDWMLLSGVLWPRYSTLLNLKKSAKDDTVTKGYHYDSKNDLTFEDVLDDEFRNEAVTANTLFPSMIPETVFKKPKVQMSEARVQTMSTSIHYFPVASRTHPVPWGLDTEELSPLTTHNITAHHSYKSNKLDDQEFLNNIGSFLKSPTDIDDYFEDYVAINDEGVVPTSCEYEGFVQVDRSNYGFRSVATNTIHIPMRQGSSHLIRHRAWRHAAKQYLSDEDRVDKRESIHSGNTLWVLIGIIFIVYSLCIISYYIKATTKHKLLFI